MIERQRTEDVAHRHREALPAPLPAPQFRNFAWHSQEEPDTAFIVRIPQLKDQTEFLRTLITPSDETLRAMHRAGTT